jgi:predicted metal-dependent peptidase
MTKPTQLTEAMSNLIAQHPFFASYLFNTMKVEYKPDTETAATNGVTIYVGDWFLQRPVRERVFVLAHEILHAVLDHLPRAKKYADRGFGMDLKPFSRPRSNLAMDAVINAALVASQIGDMPAGCVYRGSADADRTWDDVYLEMEEPPEQDPDGGQGRLDEHMAPDPNGPSEAEQKQAVAQARNAAQAAGKLSAGLSRLVGEILEPKLPWRQLLRDFVVSHAGKDEASWRRLNRRRLVLPPSIPFPGRDGCQLNCIVLAVDTSGSISPETLTSFMGEIRSILEEVRPRETHVLWWDTAAKHVLIEEPEDLASQEAYGGGGTNWDCVPRTIQAMDLEPDCVVTLTDGDVMTCYTDTPWPHLTVTTHREMPFGKNIRLET